MFGGIGVLAEVIWCMVGSGWLWLVSICISVGELNNWVMLNWVIVLCSLCGLVLVGCVGFMFGIIEVNFSVGLNSVNGGKVGRFMLLGFMLNVVCSRLIWLMKWWWW